MNQSWNNILMLKSPNHCAIDANSILDPVTGFQKTDLNHTFEALR